MELKKSKAKLPTDWQEITVEELKAPIENALSTGPFGSSISSQFFQKQGIPVIRGGNLSIESEVRFKDDGLVFISREKAIEFKRSMVRKNDLIFTCWGTINQIGLIDDQVLYPEYVISNKQMKFTPDQNKAISLFLYYLFSGAEIQKEIKNQSIGSSVPGFNLGQLRAMRLRLPPLSEQCAIAAALSDVDSLLTGLDALIAKKRAIKQGAMQELLTGKTRLPGFSGEWEVKKLGEISIINSGGTPSTSVYEYYDGTIPWVSITDMTKRGKYISETDRNITEKGLANSSAKIFPVGTVLYAMYASIGECSIAKIELSCSQAILGIRPKPTLNNEFLYFYLSSKKDEIKVIGQQGTQANLNAGMVKNFVIPLPKLNEQESIIGLLLDMDEEINNLEKQHAKTHLLKQGMMQELLTGRTRLV